jgi:hypothetical protein
MRENLIAATTVERLRALEGTVQVLTRGNGGWGLVIGVCAMVYGLLHLLCQRLRALEGTVQVILLSRGVIKHGVKKLGFISWGLGFRGLVIRV